MELGRKGRVGERWRRVGWGGSEEEEALDELGLLLLFGFEICLAYSFFFVFLFLFFFRGFLVSLSTCFWSRLFPRESLRLFSSNSTQSCSKTTTSTGSSEENGWSVGRKEYDGRRRNHQSLL